MNDTLLALCIELGLPFFSGYMALGILGVTLFKAKNGWK